MTKRVAIIIGLIVLLLIAGGSYLYWQRIRADVNRREESPRMTIWLLDSLEKQTKSSAVDQDPSSSIAITAAQNEYESFQVAIQPSQDSSLKFELADFRAAGGDILPKGNLTLFKEDYVNVDPRSDSWGRAGQWPDPLTEVKENQIIAVPAGERSNFLVDVYVPRDQPAGTYQTTLNLISDGARYPLQISLRVWNFSLPDEMQFKTSFGYSSSLLKIAHSLDNDQQLKNLIEDVYNPSFAQNRISPYWPQIGLWPKIFNGTNVNIDFSEADRVFEKWISSGKFNSFYAYGPGPIPTDISKNQFRYSMRPEKINNFVALSDEYQAAYINYYRQLAEHLAQKGWLDEAVVHYIYDELCTPDETDTYKTYANLIETANQGLLRSATIYTRDDRIYCGQWENLEGSTNLWIPHLSTAWDTGQIADKISRGQKVWLYFAGYPQNPRQPGPNTFIDHRSINQRIIPWIAYKYGVSGMLYYSLNNWLISKGEYDCPVDGIGPCFKNPWQQPRLYKGGYAGTGFFYYPPCGKEVESGICPETETGKVAASLRLKMIRDGIEDYEYLKLVEQRRGEQLAKQYANRLVDSKADFVTSSERFLSVRDEIGDLLSASVHPGDLNCDKVVNESDLSNVLTRWNTQLNNNCLSNVPINEIIMSQVLSNWRRQY